jgi:hypothetical protein
VTLAPYPGVPKDQVGFRIQVTAANTDEQIEQLIRVIGEVALRYRLRPAACGDAPETPKAKLLLIAPSPEDEGSEPLGSDPPAT